MPSKGLLIAEFLLLFVALPVVFRLLPVRLSPLPALWLAAWYCAWTLRRAPEPVSYWNTRGLAASLPGIVAIFAASAIAVTAAVYWLRPHLLFGFVRTNPIFWAVVMVLYPLLSVLPQGVIYRVFFFERYEPLFGSTAALILASAAAFGFSHLIFRSPWSVALTFVAGVLFAWRYHATGSLLVSSLEHALYGCYMFTVGLGGLFYHGAGRAAVGK
jgi:membrane protease YdiL (CAAX protease family)